MRKKIYIAGPMTGLPNYNRQAFYDAAERLTAVGYDPVHTADLPDGWDYGRYIKTAIKRLSKCDAIYLLPGWQDSRGVTEYELPAAQLAGMEVVYGE